MNDMVNSLISGLKEALAHARSDATKIKEHHFIEGEKYNVVWSEEDGEYLGTCASFPSLSYLSKSREQALEGIVKTVSEVKEDVKSGQER